jgi:hypothetical protein
MAPEMKHIPPGAVWRILYHEAPTKRGGICGKAHHLCSSDYPANRMGARTDYKRHPTRTIFDEIVVSGVLHLEQMSDRTWFLCVGENKVMITVGRDGRPKMGEWYR